MNNSHLSLPLYINTNSYYLTMLNAGAVCVNSILKQTSFYYA